MLLHATAIAINNQAILLTGAPGTGKSDLALRLIDDGAILIADDQTLLHSTGSALIAAPPATIAGMLEIRHIGLFHLPHTTAAVRLCVEMAEENEILPRLPDRDFAFFLEHRIERLRLSPFAASTPAKIRAFLTFKRTEE